MKLNDPRLTLMAGLALALNLDTSARVHGADVASKKTVKVVKSQTGAYPTLPSGAQGLATPPLSATPLVPTADPLNMAPNTQFVPGNPSDVTTVPMQLGTQPALAPTNRPPMGMFYGEQEKLDSITNPSARPLQPVVPPGSVPVNQIPLNSPGVIDGSGVLQPPVEGMIQYGMADRFGYAPPPGTLGQTYKRRSRPIDENKHPRMGVVEVNLPEYVDVTAKGLKPKWTGKVWRLESDSLVPGIPHIYEVKASWGEGTTPQVRTVRLIMGRVVDLDF